MTGGVSVRDVEVRFSLDLAGKRDAAQRERSRAVQTR